MAEISLEEAQEQQQLKSRIAPFRSRGSGPTTVANTDTLEKLRQEREILVPSHDLNSKANR